jgi:carbonic anhydrase
MARLGAKLAVLRWCSGPGHFTIRRLMPPARACGGAGPSGFCLYPSGMSFMIQVSVFRGAVALLCAGSLVVCFAADGVPPPAAAPVHWSYGGEAGPSRWGSLSPDYALCGAGAAQSPIDIPSSVGAAKARWQIRYGSSGLHLSHHEHVEDIIDNGHTIQLDVDEGSSLTVADETYALKQLHFHVPSEHTIAGRHAAMEIHLVHQSAAGRFAVLGVLVEEGDAPNPEFAKLVANLPAAKGETRHVPEVSVRVESHLPTTRAAHHYVGSLTTPPCLESVQWLVLQQPVLLAKSQISAIADRIGPNARPTQALHAREVEPLVLEGE